MINFFKVNNKVNNNKFINRCITERYTLINPETRPSFGSFISSDGGDAAAIGTIALVVIGVSAVLLIMNFIYRYFMKKMANKGYIDRPVYIESSYNKKFRRILESDTSILSVEGTPESSKFRQICSKIIKFLNRAFEKAKPVISFIAKTISYFASNIKERIKKVINKYHNNPEELKEAIAEKKGKIIRLANMPVLKDKLNGLEKALQSI